MDENVVAEKMMAMNSVYGQIGDRPPSFPPRMLVGFHAAGFRPS